MPNMKLIKAIISHLKKEAEKSDVSPDTKESLEVAVQCLQTAYDLDSTDDTTTALPFTLEEIFETAQICAEGEGELSVKLKNAEMMKNLGNNLMKSNQFVEALKYYSAAIDLDNQNAIYYGNRAAAYSKLSDFKNAIKDCEKAIEIDPYYAKAYGRMGLAYASLGQNDDAIKAFKKAVELDPTNESYQSNVKIALEKKEKPTINSAGGLAGLSSVDWHTLFTNPAFRNMASTLMQDPNIISAMASSLSPPSAGASSGGPGGSIGGVAGAGSADNASGTVPNPTGSSGMNLDMLLEAGQYLAAQMQAANPDLVEQFRQTTSRTFNRQNQDNRDSSTQ